MSKYKVINLFDKIFITISIFLLVYAWINFFIRNLWATFLLSLIFTFACIIILFHILNKHDEKKTLNKKNIQDMEEKFLAFRLMSKSNRLNLIKSIIEKTCECKKIKDSLVFQKENKTEQILIVLEKEKLTQFDLINLIQNLEKNVNILKVICCDFETNLNTKILKNLEIEIIPKKKLYEEYFLPYNSLPNCSNLNIKKDRKKFKEIIGNFFISSKAKSYFLCGLVLIFSSIILPYHYYYLIFGSVLLIFSVICKLQPYFIR